MGLTRTHHVNTTTYSSCHMLLDAISLACTILEPSLSIDHQSQVHEHLIHVSSQIHSTMVILITFAAQLVGFCC